MKIKVSPYLKHKVPYFEYLNIGEIVKIPKLPYWYQILRDRKVPSNPIALEQAIYTTSYLGLSSKKYIYHLTWLAGENESILKKYFIPVDTNISLNTSSNISWKVNPSLQHPHKGELINQYPHTYTSEFLNIRYDLSILSIDRIVSIGNLRLLKYVESKGVKIHEKIMCKAIETNNVNIVKYLCKKFHLNYENIYNTYNDLNYMENRSIYYYGHLNVLQWLGHRTYDMEYLLYNLHIGGGVPAYLDYYHIDSQKRNDPLLFKY